MKRLLITLTSGIFVFLPLNLERTKPLKAQSLLKTCLNYPYDSGINLRQMRSGSFRLLSTSNAKIKINKPSFDNRAIREATLKAKLNISNFIKLTNPSGDKDIKDIGFPIRINGRVIKTNSQLKNKLKSKLVSSPSKLKGVINIAMCKEKSSYVKVTLEVTNTTISAAEFMKRN